MMNSNPIKFLTLPPLWAGGEYKPFESYATGKQDKSDKHFKTFNNNENKTILCERGKQGSCPCSNSDDGHGLHRLLE